MSTAERCTAEQLAQLVTLADAHREADEYRAGTYQWTHGGACSIGCTILDAVKIGVLPKGTKRDSHKSLATVLGVPEQLTCLQDAIFEGLPDGARRDWTPRFLRAVASGADYSMVWPRFGLWLLTDGPVRHGLGIRPDVDAAVKGVADLYREWVTTGAKPAQSRWVAARDAACAPRGAACAARDAACAARGVAWGAAWGAACAACAACAAWGKMADRLILEMEACHA